MHVYVCVDLGVPVCAQFGTAKLASKDSRAVLWFRRLGTRTGIESFRYKFVGFITPFLPYTLPHGVVRYPVIGESNTRFAIAPVESFMANCTAPGENSRLTFYSLS